MKEHKGKPRHRAKRLRKGLTETERYLWKYLRSRQLGGYKFRRQQPIGKYIVDFVNFERKVIIEVDGGQHSVYKRRDRIRDRYLRERGYCVLRFWNNEVLNNIEGVLDVILSKLSPSPRSSPVKGEGEIPSPSPRSSPVKGEEEILSPSPWSSPVKGEEDKGKF